MIPVVVIVMYTILSEQYLTGSAFYSYSPDQVIRVTSVILEPHLMPNPDYVEDSKSPRFIGFIPDLLHEIAELTGMKYVIVTSPGNTFGYKQSDGSWDGMIGELLRHEADLAAAPMYQTAERAKVVDFSIPYMDVHATLLIRKPLRGSRPRITSVADLLDHADLRYGTLDRGILVRAFKSTNSTLLRTIWRNMVNFQPSVFTASNREGIARVRHGKYAFIIPHTIGHYMATRQPCDLVTIDRFLLDTGYCLAVNKGSELLTPFNLAIRTLRDNGRLANLYRAWWLDRGQCDHAHSSKMYGSAFVSRSSPTRMRGSTVLVVDTFPFLVTYLCVVICR